MEVFIFSQDEQPLTVISEDTGLVETHYRIEVNSVPTEPFSFVVDAQHPTSEHVKDENKVVFKDHEGDYRLFVIKRLKDSSDISGSKTRAVCLPVYHAELNDHVIEERRFIDQTVDVAMEAAVQGTRWQAVTEVELGRATTNFYRIFSTEALEDIINTWGGEIKDVVTFDERTNRITGCYLKLIQRHGKEHGQRMEIGHNVVEIEREVLSYPKTALYGFGSSLEVEDEDGEHTGGYTRYIDFADVEWKKSNGDPVDKPLGQKWVGDPGALKTYGYEGGVKHRFGIFSNQDYEDPEDLLYATWEALQKANKPEVNYRLSVNLFNEKVSLGDTSQAIDRKFARPIEIQARVIAMEYDLMDIEGTTVVEMGQFLDLGDDLDDLRKEIEGVKNNPPSARIDENSYPNRKPSTPVDLEAYGGMEVIQLYWQYADEMFIKHYEVYGSRTEDFVPDTQYLLWRGDVSAFSHTVGTDEVWYYRVRAVNYHGRPSDWSVQIRAATNRVLTEDIMWGPELAERMRELHRVSDIIGENGVDFNQISQEAKDLINQQARIYTDEEIQATRDGILSDLDDRTDYLNNRIADLNKRADGLVSRADGVDDILYDYNVRIDETERGLEFKADSLEVDQINRTVEGHTTEIELLATGLSSKVDETFVREAIGDIEIGGRNLVTDTSDEFKEVTLGLYSATLASVYLSRAPIQIGDTISYRLYMKPLNEYGGNARLSFYKEDGSYTNAIGNVVSGGEEGYSEITAQIPEDTVRVAIMIQNQNNGVSGTVIHYKELKAEKGTKATDWTPAPEDILTVQENHNTLIDQNSRRIDLQANSIIDIEGSISSAQAEIKIMSDEISERVTKTIFNSETGDLRQSIAETRNFAEGIGQTVSSIEIGGRNLASIDAVKRWGNGLWSRDGYKYTLINANGNTNVGLSIDRTQFENNTEYVVSFKVKKVSGVVNTMAGHRNAQASIEKVYKDGVLIDALSWSSGDINYNNSEGVHEYAIYFTTSINAVESSNQPFYIQPNRADYGEPFEVEIWDLQLEKGNKKTEWQPAFEDTDQRMTQAESSITQLADDIKLKVDVDKIVSEININREGIRLSGALIHLDGLSLIDEAIIQNAHIADGTIERAKLERAIIGTAQIDDLAVTSAKISSVNADKINAANLQAISANMGTLRSGRLLSNNNNMDLNLNTGNLTMRNAHFTLGSGARIDFTNVSNRIQYADTEGGVTRSSGFGVGKSLSGFPFAYSGTTGASNLDTLSPYWSGAIWNTTRAIADGASNSISGFRFQFRAQAVDWDRGLEIDFNGSPSITPINGASYNYDLGNNDRMFNDLYIRRLRTTQSFDVRNVANINKGWLLETSESGGTMSIRGLNGGSYTYVLGDTESYNHFSYGYITNLRAPSSGNSSVGLSSRPYTFGHFDSFNVYGNLYAQKVTETSDRRKKKNIKNTELGLAFINQLTPVDYEMIDSSTTRIGFVAQEMSEVLNSYNYMNQEIVSEDGQGYLGISYTQLIAPIVKATQELDLKLEEEIKWQRIEYQYINNEVKKLKDENKALKERVKKLEESAA
ncbi:hypothetical protein J18TS1_12660 [Oceanobacillus oncorhynchi subsp. incaldanensis]|uniref:phage tail spike protein n=1 Tax=Oceanobacillus oncorhynchi TaxID=545501 RepID=UPI001AFE4165|nr:phage tail spike protein [Oceanobacillus oncorhynchi]GIO18166.1 hypothetical protein J18TS1_12660 [Oceanobacillus oncorhynchi subsp. incaldanensis]